MYYFPTKNFRRNHLGREKLHNRIRAQGFEIKEIIEEKEKLYSDEYESTLLTALAKKPVKLQGVASFINSPLQKGQKIISNTLILEAI